MLNRDYAAVHSCARSPFEVEDSIQDQGVKTLRENLEFGAAKERFTRLREGAEGQVAVSEATVQAEREAELGVAA